MDGLAASFHPSDEIQFFFPQTIDQRLFVEHFAMQSKCVVVAPHP
jgi:hypothetical protein